MKAIMPASETRTFVDERMHKSKLVTVFAKGNNGFSGVYPDFTYSGGSNSRNIAVSLSFPTFPENCVYYEHFKSPADVSPTSLSIIFIGGSENAKFDHDFKEYKNVKELTFSNNFHTIHSAFQIASQLKSCESLIFHINEKTLEWTKHLGALMKFDKEEFFSPNIRSLRIELDSQVKKNPQKFGPTVSGIISDIARYSLECLPKLRNVKASSFGPDLKLIEVLLHNKQLIGTHKISLIEGTMMSCEPTPSSHPSADPRLKTMPVKTKPIEVNAPKNMEPTRQLSVEPQVTNGSPLQNQNQVLMSPKDGTVKETTSIGIATLPIKIKVESEKDNKVQTKDQKDVQVLSPPAAPPIPLVDLISSDSEEDWDDEPPLKKSKVEIKTEGQENDLKLANSIQPPASAAGRSNNALQIREMPDRYSWEDDSEEEEGAANVLELAKQIPFDPIKVKAALQTVSAISDLKDDMGVARNSRPSVSIPKPKPTKASRVEYDGVQYERPVRQIASRRY